MTILTSSRRFLAATLVFATLVLSQSCKQTTKVHDGQKPTECPSEPPFHGYNISFEAPVDIDRLIADINRLCGITIDKTTQVRVCPCGSLLVNIDYPNLEFSGHGPLKVKDKDSGQGGDIDLGVALSTSKNFEFTSDPVTETDSVKQIYAAMERAVFNQNKPIQDRVKIAIFDSGLDAPFLDKDYIGFKNDGQSCLSTEMFATSQLIGGLNLAPVDVPATGSQPTPFDIKDITDKTATSHHGTNVALLTAEQFQNSKKGVQLLIMKVLNNQNKGDGYGIICAMQLAKSLGAQIFNMSLGYYGPEDEILKKQIQEISEQKIWIVTAAGNSMDAFNGAPGGPNAPANRNLDMRSNASEFYPAYFSSPSNRVLSATTVRNTTGDQMNICEGQNYGPRSVDIGVLPFNCAFWVYPVSSVGQKGTSFATPVLSGWLGANIDLSSTKSQIYAKANPGANLDTIVISKSYIKPIR
jgi:hypothetical protein